MAPTMTIVGIGASAGGIEALRELFGHMPADSGMTFVVITHLAPGRESVLAEIVGRSTNMPVSQARDGMELQPDHVYVIPPNGLMTIAANRLRVRQVDPQSLLRHPIDVFLASLAQHSGENAVGIILSGSGNDGTLGGKAIEEQGGLTVAQGSDHQPPRHTGMPDSAIGSGLVDLVLPLNQMPEALVTYLRGADPLGELAAHDGDQREAQERATGARQAVYTILRERLGHDFSGYKETTFLRRLQRRMKVLQAADLAAYVERLRQEPDEASLLFRDLLIGVTDFFRDPDAFAALEQQVIPRLFEGKGPGDKVRVWVPGCATGEEVYSLAILLSERASTLSSPPEIKIYASDINQPALEIARAGRYPSTLLQAVSPERLSRFFVEDVGTYAIIQSVRDMCVFSLHSLVRDPPFSRLDLISCRNLLIYLTADKQRAVIPLFHYALRADGFLFLGGAESLTRHDDLFSALDKKQRIFQRRDHVFRPAHLSITAPGTRQPLAVGITAQASIHGGLDVRRSAEERVLDRYAPAHVVVNGNGEIVHYSSRTGNYLEAPSGQPSRHLPSLARKGLRLELRAALQQARDTHQLVTREHVPVEIGRDIQLVDVVVEALPDHHDAPLYLVLFVNVGPPRRREAVDPAGAEPDPTVERLERELRETRELLQSTHEEYETGVEELKSSNEELLSLNEEMQSANEELETNKEELQSLNEELNTVNAELSLKVDQLNRSSSDLANLFDGTQVALVFLDEMLLIRNFTAAAAGLFSLIPTDRGRPLSDVTHQLDYDHLDQDIRSALTAGRTIERRVHRRDGESHFLVRILPYRDSNGIIDGVIITLFGIDVLVEAERRQQAAISQLETRLRQQGAIAEFGAKALRADDLDTLLDQASVLVADGLRIERAKVLELLPGGDRLLVRAGVGWGEGVVGTATIGADAKSPAGFALQTGEPVVSDDFASEDRFDVPALLREHGIKSAVNVIIRDEGAPFGVLEVDSTTPCHFAQDDINFMQSCANLVALAIGRLRGRASLERALEAKQVLLYELQHRVKNSLQEVSALVGIERRKITNPELRRPLEVLGGRLEALSIVYRKLYLVDHQGEIDLGEYLAELADELFAFHAVDPEAITQELRLISLPVDLDSVMPIGLIACEFIVNTFKHAFPEGRGHIGIRLETVGGDAASLTLTDNGIGLPRPRNQSTGAGLKLIERLVEQMGGKLQIIDEPGTIMTVTFPLRRVQAPTS